jgi:phosphohistidine phosphatase
LNKRGLRDAPRMGRWIQDQKVLPDMIASSPAERAKTTARLVAEACGYTRQIKLVSDFYGGGPEAYVHWLQSLPEDCRITLVVGHNPDLETLLTILTGEVVALPTTALAEVELTVARWDALARSPAGKLRNLWNPKDLPQE